MEAAHPRVMSARPPIDSPLGSRFSPRFLRISTARPNPYPSPTPRDRSLGAGRSECGSGGSGIQGASRRPGVAGQSERGGTLPGSQVMPGLRPAPGHQQPAPSSAHAAARHRPTSIDRRAEKIAILQRLRIPTQSGAARSRNPGAGLTIAWRRHGLRGGKGEPARRRRGRCHHRHQGSRHHPGQT